MKKTFLRISAASIALCIATFSAYSNTPVTCVSYQARITDATGMPLVNAGVRLKVSFIQDTLGATAYIEEQLVQTDAAGMLNASIGCGKALFGRFDALDWGAHTYFLKVEIDPKGGTDFTALSETKILTVPTAIWASHSSDWVKMDTLLTNANTSGLRIRSEFWLQAANEQVFARLGKGASYVGLDGGNFGVGKTPGAARLDIKGQLSGSSTMIAMRCNTAVQDPWITSYDENDNRMWVLNMGDRSENDQFGLYYQGAGKYLFKVTKDGLTIVDKLQITGGDVAEARHPVAGQRLQPGMVVVFDEASPGKIRMTTRAYDKKVAGVISGAGDKYFAGLCLLQEELANGALPLAQIGTVEVWCVGPVAVGDLLTTSDVPGYAMAVGKPLKGIGATIGKATTSLKKGARGLVEMQIEKH